MLVLSLRNTIWFLSTIVRYLERDGREESIEGEDMR